MVALFCGYFDCLVNGAIFKGSLAVVGEVNPIH
jgi:hypothetical protein